MMGSNGAAHVITKPTIGDRVHIYYCDLSRIKYRVPFQISLPSSRLKDSALPVEEWARRKSEGIIHQVGC